MLTLLHMNFHCNTMNILSSQASSMAKPINRFLVNMQRTTYQ